MNRSIVAPITVFLGILCIMALMANSTIFDPLIRFIHSGAVTPLQTAACLFFTVAGFAACYFLLNLLCSYFVPRIPAGTKGDGEPL